MSLIFKWNKTPKYVCSIAQVKFRNCQLSEQQLFTAAALMSLSYGGSLLSPFFFEDMLNVSTPGQQTIQQNNLTQRDAVISICSLSADPVLIASYNFS